MPYVSIFGQGKGTAPLARGGLDFSGGFQPGQYAAINAQIAASQPKPQPVAPPVHKTSFFNKVAGGLANLVVGNNKQQQAADNSLSNAQDALLKAAQNQKLPMPQRASAFNTVMGLYNPSEASQNTKDVQKTTSGATFGKRLASDLYNAGPKQIVKTAALFPDIAKLGAGELHSPQQAEKSAKPFRQDFAQSIPGFVTKAGIRAVTSITKGADKRVIRPSNPNVRELLGGDIPSYHKQYSDERASGKSPLSAGFNTGLTAFGDLAAIGGAIKGATGALSGELAPTGASVSVPSAPSKKAASLKVGDTVQVPIGKLTSYEDTVPARVAEYKARIKNGGVTDPLKVEADTLGNLGVGDGKHRLEALKQSGAKTAPVEVTATNKGALAKVMSARAESPFIEGPVPGTHQNPVSLPGLPQANNVKTAIRNSESLGGGVVARTQNVASRADRIVGKSTASRDAFITAVEHPEQLKVIAAKTKDPEAYAQLVNDFRDLTNHAHAARTASGEPVGYLENYFHHNVDLSNPETAQKYEQMVTDRIAQGSASRERAFTDLKDLRSHGFNIKDQSLGNAIREWGGSESNVVKRNALANGVTSFDPTLQTITSSKGLEFRSGNADVQKALRGYESNPLLSNKVVKGIDTANTTLKQISLMGGMFHDLKTSIRNIGENLFHPSQLPDILKAEKMLISPKAMDKYNAKLISSGERDVIDAAGVGSRAGIDTRGINVEKLNPLSRAIFDRKIAFFKDQSLLGEAKRAGITAKTFNPEDAAQLAKLREIGDQVNNWYGGINLKVAARSPQVQQILRFMTLAPDFTEGKLRSVNNALNPFAAAFKTAGGNLARRQIIGEAVTAGILATVADAALNGKMPTGKEVAGNFVDPQFKLPYQNAKGDGLVAKLPGSMVTDVTRAVKDPAHFLAARTASLPSTIASIATNKDYYGDPLTPNPNANILERSGAALKGKQPIPVAQAEKTASGKQSALTALLNIGGVRVSQDPNSPGVKSTTAYFNALDNARKGLPSYQDQNAFDTIHPGAKLKSLTADQNFDSAKKASIYLDQPAVLAADAKIEMANRKAGGIANPFFDLTPEQQKKILINRLSGSAYAQTKGQPALKKQDWYGSYKGASQSYYNSLPKKKP